MLSTGINYRFENKPVLFVRNWDLGSFLSIRIGLCVYTGTAIEIARSLFNYLVGDSDLQRKVDVSHNSSHSSMRYFIFPRKLCANIWSRRSWHGNASSFVCNHFGVDIIANHPGPFTRRVQSWHRPWSSYHYWTNISQATTPPWSLL